MSLRIFLLRGHEETARENIEASSWYFFSFSFTNRGAQQLSDVNVVGNFLCCIFWSPILYKRSLNVCEFFILQLRRSVSNVFVFLQNVGFSILKFTFTLIASIIQIYAFLLLRCVFFLYIYIAYIVQSEPKSKVPSKNVSDL